MKSNQLTLEKKNGALQSVLINENASYFTFAFASLWGLKIQTLQTDNNNNKQNFLLSLK